MQLNDLPRLATWQHSGVRSGYEVLFTDAHADGYRLRGSTTALAEQTAWSVGYRVDLDPSWHTRLVVAVATTIAGERRVSIRRLADDQWAVNGLIRPDLDGCLDVDFESSSVTNTVPVHRMEFVPGEPVTAPAVFVRADDLRVHRIEQRYTLTSTTVAGPTFAYESATFDFACELTFDTAGLIRSYPGIAVRDR
jgi:hypothetical protein